MQNLLHYVIQIASFRFTSKFEKTYLVIECLNFLNSFFFDSSYHSINMNSLTAKRFFSNVEIRVRPIIGQHFAC